MAVKQKEKLVLPAMPVKANVTKQVDFLLVTYGKHPAMQALDLLPQVGVILGKLIGSIPGLSLAELMDPEQDLSQYGPALAVVFQELQDMEREEFVLASLRYTLVEAQGLSATYIDSSSKVSAYFGDNLLTLLKVLFGAMKQTYGNFIDVASLKKLMVQGKGAAEAKVKGSR